MEDSFEFMFDSAGLRLGVSHAKDRSIEVMLGEKQLTCSPNTRSATKLKTMKMIESLND